MKVVIVAAGMGIRLGPVSNELPKGLIEIGGKALLERSLEAVASLDSSDVQLTDEGKERVWNKRKRTERTEVCESGKFLNCFYNPIFSIPFVPYSLFLHVQVTEY